MTVAHINGRALNIESHVDPSDGPTIRDFDCTSHTQIRILPNTMVSGIPVVLGLRAKFLGDPDVYVVLGALIHASARARLAADVRKLMWAKQGFDVGCSMKLVTWGCSCLGFPQFIRIRVPVMVVEIIVPVPL